MPRRLNQRKPLWLSIFASALVCCSAFACLPTASTLAQQESPPENGRLKGGQPEGGQLEGAEQPAASQTETHPSGTSDSASTENAASAPDENHDTPDANHDTEQTSDAEEQASTAWTDNDAVVFGLLAIILGLVFWTHQQPAFRRFYQIVPMLLLCYFLPSLLTLFHIVDAEKSRIYFVATRYLLPACLVLLTLSIDLREILRLGPKALIMFLAGTFGVVIGGPLAIFLTGLFAPDLVGGGDVWRGLSTVAGSWIGGGANQAAMKEIFEPSDAMYSTMVAVDVIVAEVWMLFLLIGVGKAKQIDAFFRADASSVETLRAKMEHFSLKTAKIPTATDLMVLLAFSFGATAVCHIAADILAPWIGEAAPYLSRFSLDSKFFWLIVLATTGGVLMSFTPARQLEGAGASRIGTIFIFILVASIGLNMDITAIFKNPGLFVVGGIWMAIHVFVMLLTAYLIRAPYFFLAVGSKANIGGAASAPVVAAAFHPSLAPVGVLLAVLGYALGTYGAWLCAIMMRAMSPA